MSVFRQFFMAIFMLTVTLASTVGAANLTVSPLIGGNSLRFGREDVSVGAGKEVRVRISATSGKQYQVFQRLLEPFVNERGEMLNTRVLRFNATIGSNASGTLYGQGLDGVSSADQLLYSSAGQGESDGFTLVYSIDRDRMTSSGRFQGKLLLTLRSTDGSAPEEVFLDIFIEAYSDYRLDIRAEQAGNVIRLGTDNLMGRPTARVDVDIVGYIGPSLKIYQEVVTPLKKETGEDLDWRALQIQVNDSQGRMSGNPTPLSFKRGLLYQTNLSDEKVNLTYSLSDDENIVLVAGQYRGQIRYVVDNGTGEQVYPFDIELNIAPIFEVGLAFPEGEIRFKQVIPQSPPKIHQVEVNVKSNLGKPYVVTQEIKSKMINQKGEEFDHAYFTEKGELPEGMTGKIGQPEFVSVPVGTTPIFFSDRRGTPAIFRVYYRLTPYNNMPAGDFTTAVIYSLSEL